MNVVVLQGTVVRFPEVRELPSGSRLVSFDVRTEGPEGRPETVPVSWAGSHRENAPSESMVTEYTRLPSRDPTSPKVPRTSARELGACSTSVSTRASPSAIDTRTFAESIARLS